MTATPAMEIKNAAIARLAGFAGVTKIMRTPVPPTQPTFLPRLGIYYANETMSVDGDFNIGIPKFVHDATLAFEFVMSGGGDQDDTDLDGLKDELLETLLTDGTFIALFEGVKSITSVQRFPREGDTIYAMLTIRMVISFRTEWEPVATVPLETIDVRATGAYDEASGTEIPIELEVTGLNN